MQSHTRNPVLAHPTGAKGDSDRSTPRHRDGGGRRRRESQGQIYENQIKGWGERKALLKSLSVYIQKVYGLHTPNPPT